MQGWIFSGKSATESVNLSTQDFFFWVGVLSQISQFLGRNLTKNPLLKLMSYTQSLGNVYTKIRKFCCHWFLSIRTNFQKYKIKQNFGTLFSLKKKTQKSFEVKIYGTEKKTCHGTFW